MLIIGVNVLTLPRRLKSKSNEMSMGLAIPLSILSTSAKTSYTKLFPRSGIGSHMPAAHMPTSIR
jgi:hypothetical protein